MSRPLPDRRLLWIAPKPFDPEKWPLLSKAYVVQSAHLTETCEPVVNDVTAIVLSAPADELTRRFEDLRAAVAGTPFFAACPEISPAEAVRISRHGIDGFFSSDREAVEVLAAVGGERSSRGLIRLAAQTAMEEWERLLIGESPPMRQVRHIIRMVGCRHSTVLISGETGTGKELAARALHLAGPRRLGPWVAVNCSALPENLLEAELFGHVRGAFTGALQNRTGRFEAAQGGTLFLDEVGDLPVSLQAKLLRVLQEREFQRLGSSETIRLDVRIVAATNCDLNQRMADGRFREDLYYRLNVVPIHMPPLRQRPSDIPWLAEHFVREVCRQEQLAGKRLSGNAIQRLVEHSWPGNVRQLQNAVEKAVVLSGDRDLLDAADFAVPVALRAPQTGNVPPIEVPDQGFDYEEVVAGIERSILAQALRKTGGNKKAAADMLGLKRTTLSAKVRSLA